MRTTGLLALFALTLSLTACDKKIDESSRGLTGTWELAWVSGSMPATAFPPGNGNLLKFTDNGYEKYLNGVLVGQGSYSIVHDTSASEEVCLVLPEGTYGQRFVFEGARQRPKPFFELSGDTLRIVSGCFAYDGGSLEAYGRIPSAAADR